MRCEMRLSLVEALTPLKLRLGSQVSEQEIFRIAAYFTPDISADQLKEVRREILQWAKRRAGGVLPREAWEGASFEYLAGGRTTIAARVTVPGADIWSLRADDPDKEVPGRIWTTEVTIGKDEKVCRLGVRQLVSTAESTLEIEPHVPGFIRQLSERFDVRVGVAPIRAEPWFIDSVDEVEQLIDFLIDPQRKRPVFVATGDERSEYPNEPLIDCPNLCWATLGLAHVVVVPSDLTYELTDRIGKARSVYYGGVRIYLPGFDFHSDPYEHRLYIGDGLKSTEGAKRCVKELRQFAARESLLRCRLDHDVVTFASVRSASLKLETKRQADTGASTKDQLTAAFAQIRALEEELTKAKDWELQLSNLYDDAENRSTTAEAQLRASVAQIQHLHQHIKSSAEVAEVSISLPQTWAEFVDWCDQNLIGRLILAPSARRGLKKPDFLDSSLAARCLLWLANECRDRRIEGGGSVSDMMVENGVWNSPCGGDEYDFDFQGRRFVADWHVRSGGNTHDPSRCLRIYYCWDDETQQIIVSDMPAHRRTDAT